MDNAQVQTLEGKFNAAQLELLKVVARPVSDDDLMAIKKLIVKYFIDKLRDRADEVWVQNNWTDQEILTMNLRVKK
jgi:hypothetical protein